MAERTLSEHQLNRAVLARQFLLERTTYSLAQTVERMGGVQAQYAPSAYIGLWSRIARFERSDLTQALERRTVVQGTLMRGTIHIVSRRDYPLLAAAIRADQRTWWLGVTRHRIPEAEMEVVARQLRRLLAGGPRPRAALIEELGVDSPIWNGVGGWVDLLRVPPSGTWNRRRADLYAAADDQIGPYDATSEDGIQAVVHRYLGAFGPASGKDIASWAGIRMPTLAPALERLRLRRFRDERGGELLDLQRAPLPDPDTPAPVRFLPTWDASLLVHARRSQILSEEHRSRVFSTKTPHSVPTFLIDGRVAGTWAFERGGVRTTPFTRLPRATTLELADEAERLAAFLV